MMLGGHNQNRFLSPVLKHVFPERVCSDRNRSLLEIHTSNS